MRGLLVILMLAAVSLGGCSAKDVFGHKSQYKEQDFKPYLGKEPYHFPMAYGQESWAYPTGTSTAEIIKRWKAAGLISHVTSRDTLRRALTRSENTLAVYVGPQFYNLSDSSRRGFAEVVGQIYGLGQDGRNTYLLYDWSTAKPVGVYTLKDGLYTY